MVGDDYDPQGQVADERRVSRAAPNRGGSLMCQSLRFRLFASCLAAGAAVACFFGAERPAGPGEKPPPSHPLYHADPDHLWNRLHAALFVRVGSDGQTYGLD